MFTRNTTRLFASLAAGALIGSAPAVELRWDILPGAVGTGDGLIDNGDGTWDTTNGNWTADNGVTNIAWDNGAGNDAELGGANGSSRIVTLGEDISVNRLRSANNTTTTINGSYQLKVGGGASAGIGNDGSRLNNFTLNVPIELQGNATFGAFTGTYRLNQDISESTPSTLSLGASITNAFYLLGDNSFTGGCYFGSGSFYLGTDTALGLGLVRITASQAPTFYSTGGFRTIANNFTSTYGTGTQTTGIKVAGSDDFKFTGTIASSGDSTTNYIFDIAAGRTAEFAGQLLSNNRKYRKTGDGTAIFSANNTFTGGSFTVAAGTMLVNGAIGGGGLTVQAGASLGGMGSIIPAVTVDAGATLTPGNSVGTLTVNGNLVFADGAGYDWEYNPTSSDLVVVNGTLTLGDTASIQVTGLDGALAPTSLVLFQANALAGATDLSGWTISGLPSYYRVEIDGLNVVLAIPEPASLALLAAVALFCTGRRASRR